jgi:hypothetical protein
VASKQLCAPGIRARDSQPLIELKASIGPASDLRLYQADNVQKTDPLVAQLVKKFMLCYGTRKFNTVFTEAATESYSEPV